MHRKRAAVILGISLTLICAVEFSLRAVYGLGTPALIRADRASGYEFLPNQYLRRFGNRIEYNAEGLRSEPLRKLTTDSVRILCLGDSVTNGGALTDQSATFPYQLEADLANSGLNVQALNASAGADPEAFERLKRGETTGVGRPKPDSLAKKSTETYLPNDSNEIKGDSRDIAEGNREIVSTFGPRYQGGAAGRGSTQRRGRARRAAPKKARRDMCRRTVSPCPRHR